MANPSTFLSATDGKKKSKPGSDDCGAGQTSSCALAALERPRFFYGQLLSDQDLTATLRWVQDRLRLARFIEGWGVVCGLGVTVVAGSDQVMVKAGYARSCCGDDIIVERDVILNVGACYKPKRTDSADPCANLATQAAEPVTICGQQIEANKLFKVDLVLVYKEEESALQTSLRRNGCQTLQHCEASRVREGYDFLFQPVKEQGDATDPFQEWQKAYKRWLKRLLSPPANGNSEDQTDKESQQLCLIMQHFHDAPLNAGCYYCQGSAGVPLARIWLTERPPGNQNGKSCVIVAVDSYPPHRRPLMLDELPAPAGKVNLAPLLWQRWDHDNMAAWRKLHALGFHALMEECVEEPSAALERVQADATDGQNLCVVRNASAVKVFTFDLGEQLGVRIIGFEEVGTVTGAASGDESPPDNGSMVKQPGNGGETAAGAVSPVPEAASSPTTPGMTTTGAQAESVGEAPGDELIANGLAGAAASLVVAPGQPDDLEKIVGVGPAFARALNRAGYTTFADVAGMDEGMLDEVLHQHTRLQIPFGPNDLPKILASARAKSQAR